MGVEVGDAKGDYVVLLECGRCDRDYESDETMDNECPFCDAYDPEVVDTDPSMPWRP